MAYGIYCQKCCGTVDRNEYDYAKDMCHECAEEEIQIELRKNEVNRLLNCDSEQIKMNIN